MVQPNFRGFEGCSEDEPKLNSLAASSVVVFGLAFFVGSSELAPNVNDFVCCSDAVVPNLNDFVAGSLVVVPNLKGVACSSVFEPNLNAFDASLADEPKLMAFDGSSEDEPNLKSFIGATAVVEAGALVTVVVLVMPNLKGFPALSTEGTASDGFAVPDEGMPNLNCAGAAANGAPPKPLDSEEGNLKLNAAAAACAEERAAVLANGRGFSHAQQRAADGWFLTRHVSHSQRDPLAAAEGAAPAVALLADDRGVSHAQQRVALVSFLTRHVPHSQRGEVAAATLAGGGATGAGTVEATLVGAGAAGLGVDPGRGVSQAWQRLAEAGLVIMHSEHDQLPAAGLKRAHRSPPPFVELLLSLSFLAVAFPGFLVSPDFLLSGTLTSGSDLVKMASPGFL